MVGRGARSIQKGDNRLPDRSTGVSETRGAEKTRKDILCVWEIEKKKRPLATRGKSALFRAKTTHGVPLLRTVACLPV